MLPESVASFIEKINEGSIPTSLSVLADYVSNGVEDDTMIPSFISEGMAAEMRSLMVHTALQQAGMFAPTSEKVAKELLSHFPGATFLDPIAGRGFMAKSLRESGAKVIAGDIEPILTVTDIESVDALELVQREKENADVLLILWSEMGNEIDAKIAMEWGAGKPIVFMGEVNGCTGSKDFYSSFIPCVDLQGDYEHMRFVKNKFMVGFSASKPDDIDWTNSKQVLYYAFDKANVDFSSLLGTLFSASTVDERAALMENVFAHSAFIKDGYIKLYYADSAESYIEELSSEEKQILSSLLSHSDFRELVDGHKEANMGIDRLCLML